MNFTAEEFKELAKVNNWLISNEVIYTDLNITENLYILIANNFNINVRCYTARKNNINYYDWRLNGARFSDGTFLEIRWPVQSEFDTLESYIEEIKKLAKKSPLKETPKSKRVQ